MSEDDFIERVNETTGACPECSSAASGYAGVRFIADGVCQRCHGAVSAVVVALAAEIAIARPGRPVLSDVA